MIAFVFGVIAASIFDGSMHLVLRIAIDEHGGRAGDPDRLRRREEGVRDA